MTPLWCAADCGQANTARAAAGGAGRPAWRRGRQGGAPIWEPRRCSRPLSNSFHEVAKVLLQHRADVEQSQQQRYHAVAVRRAGGLRGGGRGVAGVSRGREQDEHGGRTTPLHFAAYHGHVAVARLLLQSRADTSLKNQWNDTPAGARSTCKDTKRWRCFSSQAEEGGARCSCQ